MVMGARCSKQLYFQRGDRIVTVNGHAIMDTTCGTYVETRRNVGCKSRKFAVAYARNPDRAVRDLRPFDDLRVVEVVGYY